MSDKTKTKILVIEDEKDIQKAMRDTLVLENFDVDVTDRGEEGVRKINAWNPDLVILDLRLPDLDGFEVCRRVKSNPETAKVPIIIVTTRSKSTEKVVGLELGADDYLTKPYDVMEFVARVKAVLRRSSQEPEAKKAGLLRSGDLVVDIDHISAKLDEKPLKLTPKEFELLVMLLSKPGKAYRRQHILEEVWGESFDSLQGTVATHIKTLRKKLGATGKKIETVPGIGYRWVADTI